MHRFARRNACCALLRHTCVDLPLAIVLLLAAALSTAREAPYTLYAAGDIAQCNKAGPAYSGAEETAKVVEFGLAASPRSAVILLGDVVYPHGTDRDFANCYHPTWGRFKDRTWPSPGNHEYATPGASGYYKYFGKAAANGYYSVKLGAWQVISLDSNLKGAAHEAQLAWLERELAASGARCTLAYWHHPLYSSGWHGNIPHMRRAWDLLYRAGAELVLAAHDHTYERFAPQDAHGRLDRKRGVRQFVVGTGGAQLTPLVAPVANTEVRDNSRTGVLKLVLAEDGYSWEFMEAVYDGFPNGAAPDRGAAQCH